MGAQFFLSQDFEHPQENRAFRFLCSAAAQYLDNHAAVIGNVSYPGGQLDALVIGRRSITVVDFKDYGGSVRLVEDREWVTSDGVVIRGGGRDLNPYQQVLRYKRELMRRFSAAGLLPPPNDIGHISGLVLFSQPMAVDASGLSPATRKWFCAAGQEEAMDFLRDRASPRLDISAEVRDAIIQAAHAKPFELLQAERWVPESTAASARSRGYLDAMQDVEDDLNQRWWDANGERVSKEYKQVCREWHGDEG